MPDLDLDILRERRDAGEPIAELAAALAAARGVSIRRVYQMLGPARPRPRVDDATRAEIRRRALAGGSRRQIAEAMRVSRQTVSDAIGEPARDAAEAISPEQERAILTAAARGESPASIATAVGRSTAGVKRVIERDQLRDWVQDAVIARVAVLGWDAPKLAAATGLRVPLDHVAGYLARERSMGSHKLQHLLRALGLIIVAESP